VIDGAPVTSNAAFCPRQDSTRLTQRGRTIDYGIEGCFPRAAVERQLLRIQFDHDFTGLTSASECIPELMGDDARGKRRGSLSTQSFEEMQWRLVESGDRFYGHTLKRGRRGYQALAQRLR
jgi:hypothetical protein